MLFRSCKLGKQLQLPYQSSESRSKRPFNLVHSDVWGPVPFVSKDGHRYYVIFINDYSRYTWIYFMHSRSKFFRFMLLSLPWYALSSPLPSAHSDLIQGEYLSHAFRDLLATHGTLPQLACPGAHA